MNEAPTAARSTLKHLRRVPLLLLTGLLTMGSGGGNPGCGGGARPCEDNDCFVEGTWSFTFTDTRPLPPECARTGAALPSGPMELTRAESAVTGTVGDLVVTGGYSGGSNTAFFLSGDQRTGTVGASRIVYSYSGNLSTSPKSVQEPVTWTGRLFIYRESTPEGACDVTREFTATR